MKKETLERFKLWEKETKKDTKTQLELKKISTDAMHIERCFGEKLRFGTGGVRAIMGIGSSRLNTYTIAGISQGVANIVKENVSNKKCVVIGYDSRINSRKYAEITANVMAANGIDAYLFREIVPTPVLAYSVKRVGAILGIMITASHNSYEYNGYKIYDKTGLQILPAKAQKIAEEVEKIHLFKDVKKNTFEEGKPQGKIKSVPESIVNDYLKCVEKCSVVQKNSIMEDEIRIVYTPLHGTGKKYVEQILKNRGFRQVTFVEEQKIPNGEFPTCRYPNPEDIEALYMGIECAKEKKADIVLATDPDCDRVGVVVKDGEKYTHMTGNQIGVLLLDFICSQKINSQDGILIKSFVTTDMAGKIAESYGLRTINVPTGFKYIGGKMNELEENGELHSFIIGFEESCGYLSGTYIRDKDGVLGSLIICEMCAYYKAHGKTLVNRLNDLYLKYGYYVNTMYMYNMQENFTQEDFGYIMKKIYQSDLKCLGKMKITGKSNFNENEESYLCSSIVKWTLEQEATVYIRPSGTEPKIKIYIEVCSCSKVRAIKIERYIKQQIFHLLQDKG